MDSTSFTFCITFTDESQLWPNVWHGIKDQLNLHFCSVKYKELSTMKSLHSLNITMMQFSENSNLHFVIHKLNSFSDLKPTVKEKILSNYEKYKNSVFILLMDIENSDNSLKNCIKNFEKIKNELKIPDLKLLPVNATMNKGSDIINDFMKDFKLRVSNEINLKVVYLIKQVESYKFAKADNKEATYNYLVYKDSLLQYLLMAEFWEEAFKLCEADLFSRLDHLIPDKATYLDPLSFLDTTENFIRKSIYDKSITNLEYQQYLIIQIGKSLKNLRDFKRLNWYFSNKILGEIYSLKQFFPSKFHFYFWCYQYTCKLITFFKSLKSKAYSEFDEETNTKGQLTIYYQMKKYLKFFSSLIRMEIPTVRIFCQILNKNIQNENDLHLLMKEFMVSNTKDEEEYLEQNSSYLNFIKEVNENFDEKTKSLIKNKAKLFEEYLTVLVNIEKLHWSLDQHRLFLRNSIEKISILMILGKFTEIKQSLLTFINGELKNEKWDFILEYLNYIFIILLNCFPRNEENVNILLGFLNLKFRKIKELNKIFDVENENLINELLSNYLFNTEFEFLQSNGGSPNKRKSMDLKIPKISCDISNLLKFQIICSENSVINSDKHLLSVNKNSDLKTSLVFRIRNLTKMNLQFSNIILLFEDELTSSSFNFDYIHEDLKILNKENEINHQFVMDLEKFPSFKRNFLAKLKEVKFIFKSGIEGNYRISPFSEEENFKINVKLNNLQTKVILPNLSSDKDHFFFNTVYPIEIQFSNFHELNYNDKRIQIKINSVEGGGQGNFKLLKEGFQICEEYSNFIQIYDNEVIFNQGIDVKDSYFSLKLFFRVEDVDYYRGQNFKLEVLTLVSNLISDLDNLLEIKDDSNLESFYFIYRENFDIYAQHLFSLSHKFRTHKNNSIIIQSSINLNLDHSAGIKVFLEPEKSRNSLLENNGNKNPFQESEQNLSHFIEVNIMQTINLIKILQQKTEAFIYDYDSLFFIYEFDQCKYTYYYSPKHIKEKVETVISSPFIIHINTNLLNKHVEGETEKYEDGVKLFKQFFVNIHIHKCFKEEVLIMIRIKESENWTIVGKSRIIERLPSNDQGAEIKLKKCFKLIPLQDGFIKLPEIDFMEYKISNPQVRSLNNDLQNINSLEFLPLSPGSIIEGNERIVKVYSIENTTLRLNLI
jgi:hypothetical protein